MEYKDFIAGKQIVDSPSGLEEIPNLNSQLFEFQRDIVSWALRRGRAAIFADCGMGKTPMQLEWSSHIPGRVLIVAPLAVSGQTVREAGKFGIDGVKYLRTDDNKTQIVVTNYEMIDNFSPNDFEGVVLDESSILKSYTGKFRNKLIGDWGNVNYRIAATATPAPNDFMELGSHSEFIGAMRSSEMLASFFINDPGSVGKYRLKGHGEGAFWDWMSQWSVMVRKPSDLGYDDGDFQLPKLRHIEHVVDPKKPSDGMLFAIDAHTLSERQAARRSTIEERSKVAAQLANDHSDEPWLIWCDLNAESALLKSLIPGAVEVRGSDTPEQKEERLYGFAEGKYRVLVTKPSIAGYGMNLQNCARMVFTGLSDSFELYYQAVRRCWRFGQHREVEAHVVTARTEGAVVANIRRKEAQFRKLADGLCGKLNERRAKRFAVKYEPTKQIQIPSFLKTA